ncbi:MAG: hypothetical protein IPJ34_28350 [Myxococcales bacterium]|nr:hypothetical protein [Myxococcales bacterium]
MTSPRESELEALAKEDPIMAEAKAALEALSADPVARALAAMRYEQLGMRHDIDPESTVGEGSHDILLIGIPILCEMLGLGVDDALRARLAAADRAELQSIFDAIRTTKTLPP